MNESRTLSMDLNRGHVAGVASCWALWPRVWPIPCPPCWAWTRPRRSRDAVPTDGGPGPAGARASRAGRTTTIAGPVRPAETAGPALIAGPTDRMTADRSGAARPAATAGPAQIAETADPVRPAATSDLVPTAGTADPVPTAGGLTDRAATLNRG